LSIIKLLSLSLSLVHTRTGRVSERSWGKNHDY
jgi:hypothetical protein